MFVEAVYLNNDDVLKLQTSEDHHIFQWLKLQARRGAAEAEVSCSGISAGCECIHKLKCEQISRIWPQISGLSLKVHISGEKNGHTHLKNYCVIC